MAQEKRWPWGTIQIPAEAYNLLVDFCVEFLGLEDVPDEEALGSVVAYLLGAGMQAVEEGRDSEPTAQDFAS